MTIIKPMLAHKFDEARINFKKDIIYMQPKLDGVRCLFTKDGAFSRTGKQFMNVRKNRIVGQKTKTNRRG